MKRFRDIEIGTYFISDSNIDGVTLLYLKTTPTENTNCVLINNGQLNNVFPEAAFQEVEVTFEIKPTEE